MNPSFSLDMLAARQDSRGWIVGVLDDDAGRAWAKQRLNEEHALGAGQPAGKQLWQVVLREDDLQPVALVLWAASALHLKDRDAFIGWDTRTRASRLGLIVNNTRLLILEAAREPNLASQALGAALRTLPFQWRDTHGYPPLLAEAFTDIETHHGTTYKVTNWTPLGLTAGNSRQRADFYQRNDRPKKLWVKPLCKDACAILRAAQLPPALHPAQIEPTYATCPLRSAELLSLRDAFRLVHDPRRSSHRFPLSGVLTLTAIGLMCGATNSNDLLRRIRSLDQKVRAKLGMPRKKGTRFYQVPSYNALKYILCVIDQEQAAAVLARWQAQHQGLLPRNLALDGKDLGKELGIIVTLAISGGQEAGTPVAMRTADKGKELPTAQAMLAEESLNLEDTLVTADALHCQQDTARIIVGRGGDYILSLKDNQPTIAAEAQRRLQDAAPLLSRTQRKATGGLSSAS